MTDKLPEGYIMAFANMVPVDRMDLTMKAMAKELLEARKRISCLESVQQEATEQIMKIIRLALAGYEDAYKYVDTDGRRYTRWEDVRKDIRVALSGTWKEDGGGAL